MKTVADPLLQKTTSERLHYATGELLGADDFRDEQTYHRRQLAHALLFLNGSGTLAGLRVVARPRRGHGYLSNGAFAIGDTAITVDAGSGMMLAGDVITFAGDTSNYPVARALASNVVTIAGPGLRAPLADNTAITVTVSTPDEVHLEVRPGLALDRAGRLIEVPREACLRLRRWFEFIASQLPDSTLPDVGDLRAAFHAGAVVADVFLAFHPCDRGYTPAFASGPFDALDASQPSRVRDAYELSLVLRTEDNPPIAFDPWLSIQTAADRGLAAQEASLDAWDALALPAPGNVGDWHENPAGIDPTAVLLARLRIPATLPANPASAPVPDWSAATWAGDASGGNPNLRNDVRNFILPPAAIRRMAGV
ncbi:MAG: hypothetical protein WCF18_07600 [Chthoniobacteraceae bacterium]